MAIKFSSYQTFENDTINNNKNTTSIFRRPLEKRKNKRMTALLSTVGDFHSQNSGSVVDGNESRHTTTLSSSYSSSLAASEASATISANTQNSENRNTAANTTNNTMDTYTPPSEPEETDHRFRRRQQNEHRKKYDNRRGEIPPQSALLANRFTVDMLSRPPGTPFFSFWFIISTFTPTIAACVGPIANMISIGAIVDPWRQIPHTQKAEDGTLATAQEIERLSESIRDERWVIGLNIASLLVGFCANILLVLNFNHTLKYTFAQVGSILAWLLAAIILAIDLILCYKVDYFKVYEQSTGYYYGVFTCGVYVVVFGLLAINYLGYLLKEYDATFNMDESQRGLMIHTVMMGAWICLGGLIFKALMDISYANSMYFSTVTVLTIGFGDLVPQTKAAKGICLAFTFLGVLELGLIIAWLRKFVLSNVGPTLFWHRLEVARYKVLKNLQKSGVKLNARQSFNVMTRLRRRCELVQKLMSLVTTVGCYFMFWLIGAVVFSFAEGWDYFDSVYFCFLCLLTTGYGDFSPKTSIGRSFFVIWALGAVPMMTLLISSVGDALFTIASHIDEFISTITGLKHLYGKETARKKSRRKSQNRRRSTLTGLSHLVDEASRNDYYTNENNMLEENGIGGSSNEAQNVSEMTDEEYRVIAMRVIQRLLETSNNNPNKVHSYEEWVEIYNLLGETPLDNMLFLEQRSPLRFPLKESNYMMYQMTKKLEERQTETDRLQSEERETQNDESGSITNDDESDTSETTSSNHIG